MDIGHKSDRTLCDIFENMRDCVKTMNFSYLGGLIEEGQYRAERMERSLELAADSYGSIKKMMDEREKIRDEIKALKTEMVKLGQ